MSDNTRAVSYVSHMDGTKSATCTDIARETWNWVLGKRIRIRANHIPGQENKEEGRRSRTFRDHTEWILSDEYLKRSVTYGELETQIRSFRK